MSTAGSTDGDETMEASARACLSLKWALPSRYRVHPFAHKLHRSTEAMDGKWTIFFLLLCSLCCYFHHHQVNVLAHWTFEDCWSYIHKFGTPYHPPHDQGYPSVGDVHSTLPVDRRDWFKYGAERSGRFSGFTNADGSQKTECGIHLQ